MKTRWIALVFAGLAALCAGRVCAQRQEEGRDGGSKPGMHEPGRNADRPEAWLAMIDNPRIGGMLGLTEEQKKSLKEQAQEHKKKQLPLRKELEQAASEQARLLSAASPDMARLMEAVEKTGHIRTRMAKQQIENLVAVRKILTAEQREKLKDMLCKLHERRSAEAGKDRARDSHRRDWARERAKDFRKGRSEDSQGTNAASAAPSAP